MSARGGRARGGGGGAGYRDGADRGSYRGVGDRGGPSRGGYRGGNDRGSFRGGGDRGSSRGGYDRGDHRGGRGGRGREGAPFQAPREGDVFHQSMDPPDPNLAVQEHEQRVEQSLKTTASAAGELATKLSNLSIDHEWDKLALDEIAPTRPGYGTQGKPVLLYANYFEMESKPATVFHRYSLTLTPGPLPKKKHRQIIRQFIDTFPKPDRDAMATDYAAVLFTCRHFADVEKSITLQFPDEDTPSPRAPQVKVAMAKNTELPMAAILQMLASEDPVPHTTLRDQYINAFNIIMGHQARTEALDPSKMMSVGPKFYATNLNTNLSGFDYLGGGLRAVRGYFLSVRPSATRLLVNVQVKHAATFPPVPLVELMKEFCGGSAESIPHKAAGLEKFVKMLKIRTNHLKKPSGGSLPRARTIFALARPGDGSRKDDHRPQVKRLGADPNDVKFWWTKEGGNPANDGYVTVAQFFKKKYPDVVLSRGWPVVNVGNRDSPMYFPAEICRIEPGQSSSMLLSPGQTAQMIKFAVNPPHFNADNIVNYARSILKLNSTGDQKTANNTLSNFGLSTSKNLITVPGRVLDAPRVLYIVKGREQPNMPRGGQWNMRDMKFVRGSRLASWCVLCITSGGNSSWIAKDSLEPSTTAFSQALNANGIQANPMQSAPATVDIPRNQQNLNYTIYQAMKSLEGRTPRPQIILVLLPAPDIKLYNAIKIAGDCKLGIHTVCAVSSKFMKLGRDGGPDKQYFANVALKFNLKLGGRNQAIDSSSLGIVSEGKTMLVGIDVTHPSPGSSSEAPSLAGSVATIDGFAAQFLPALYVQESRKESVTALGRMMETHLSRWKSKNKTYPDNILVYRDGVSESQYKGVLEMELPQIRAETFRLYSHAKQKVPKISIVVVGKRHHTRFYPTKGTPEDLTDTRSQNPRHGTVVDRGVTEPRQWDFFLQAHTALHGTARPAHYYVVLDEIFQGRRPQPDLQNAADTLEKLTHSLCYMFGRATKAVSICPPAYYADLLCERARRHRAGEFEPGDTPISTPATSVSGDDAPLEEGEYPLHSNLRDSMFYI